MEHSFRILGWILSQPAAFVVLSSDSAIAAFEYENGNVVQLGAKRGKAFL